LRVSVMRRPVPWAAAAKARVSVAIPESRCRKLSAVRSPASRAVADLDSLPRVFRSGPLHRRHLESMAIDGIEVPENRGGNVQTGHG